MERPLRKSTKSEKLTVNYLEGNSVRPMVTTIRRYKSSIRPSIDAANGFKAHLVSELPL